MRDFRDAKAMAQTLRDALKAKSIPLTHSESLELVARTLGFQDWNVLSAAIQASEPEKRPRKPGAAMQVAPIPVAPMRDVVFFPQVMTSIFVGRDKTKRAIEAAIAGDRQLFVVTQRRPGDDDPDFAALYSVGVTAEILERLEFPDGNWRVKVSCAGRAAIVGQRNGDYLAADIAPIDETRALTVEAFAKVREILDAYESYARTPAPAYLRGFLLEPGVFSDVAVQLLRVSIDKMQEMLETGDVVTRLETVLAWMKAGPASP
jgi:ATP-dependent Lon protease